MGTTKQHFEPEAFLYKTNIAFPQYYVVDGTSGPVSGLRYDPTTEEAAFIKTRAIGYGSGNWTITICWRAVVTVTTGGVTWGISIAAITPNTDTQDVETKAYATETLVTDTHIGTTIKRLHDVIMTVSNLDSVAADDIVWIKVARKPLDAGDTMSTTDVELESLTIAYSDT